MPPVSQASEPRLRDRICNFTARHSPGAGHTVLLQVGTLFMHELRPKSISMPYWRPAACFAFMLFS